MSFQSWLKRVRYPQMAKTLSLFCRTQTMSQAEIEELQIKRVRDLVAHFSEKLPFYRAALKEAGVTASDLSSIRDVSRLPVMDKALLRAGEEEIAAAAKDAVRRSTSGSTGVNFHFYLDKSAKSAHNAFIELYTQRLGVSRGLTVGIWGGDLKKPEDNSFLQKIKLAVLKTQLLPGYGMDEERACEYLNYITKKRPTFVYGYPSYLAYLARVGEARRIFAPKGFVLVASGEQMTEQDRQVIERYFQTTVYNRYGSCEFSTIAHELPNETGFYVCPAEFLLEVNEQDELLVTDLWNFATPFIRYNIGDRAALQSENGTVKITELYGRCNDVLYTPSGKMIPSQFWTILSRMCEAVNAFQVVQITDTELVMRTQSDGDFDPAPILENFNRNFGDEMTLRVTQSEPFETTKMGKHKFVIRKESAGKEQA